MEGGWHRQHNMNLKQLASRINGHHATVLECGKIVIEKGRLGVAAAIACGQHLNEAKGKLEHGKWLPWLAENCKGISERTAQNYIVLANPQVVADLKGVSSLKEAYIKAGVVKGTTLNPASVPETGDQGESPKPSEFVRAKGLAVRLWNLVVSATDAERMLKEIEPIAVWYNEQMENKRKRETMLNDGFDTASTEQNPKIEMVKYE